MSQYNHGSGGGFLQDGSPFSASGSPGGIRNKEASHSLRPLMIAQVIKATQAHTDAEWMVDNAEIGQITLVGHVVSVQSQTTNCVYWVDDGTGRIEARHWIDSSNEEDAEKWGGIKENMCVRVTGALKTFGSKRYLNATHIKVSSDPHEIYFHILETITVTLTIDRGLPIPGQNDVSTIPNSTAAYTSQSHTSANDQFSSLPTLQRTIARFILSQPQSAEGVHVATIARAIGADGDAQKISDALDKLMDAGLVYSTIDDSHFIVSTIWLTPNTEGMTSNMADNMQSLRELSNASNF